MKNIVAFFHLMSVAFAALSLSTSAPAQPPLIVSGMDAVVGNSGWYTSNVIIYTAAFIDPNIVAPVGDILVEHEGTNEVLIPDGLGGTTTQIVNIDKTPPSVNWNTPSNTAITAGSSVLSADIKDQISGVCLVELSIDNGQSWIEGWNSTAFALNEPVKETTWIYHPSFPEFDNGAHNVILRAHDCAGNISPGEILVVQVK
jgi:hypothetical protein